MLALLSVTLSWERSHVCVQCGGEHTVLGLILTGQPELGLQG